MVAGFKTIERFADGEKVRSRLATNLLITNYADMQSLKGKRMRCGKDAGFGRKRPNQPLEHNAIAPHFLFAHVDHGVAHF